MTATNTTLCVLCKKKSAKLTNHYVNVHNTESYISRFLSSELNELESNIPYAEPTTIHQSTQVQKYKIKCWFCKSEVNDIFFNYHKHYSTHTGEYAFQCSGCGMFKPFRPDIASHICNSKSCLDERIQCVYRYPQRIITIYLHCCKMCNFVQLNKANVLKHIREQHNMNEDENQIKKYILAAIKDNDDSLALTDEIPIINEPITDDDFVTSQEKIILNPELAEIVDQQPKESLKNINISRDETVNKLIDNIETTINVNTELNNSVVATENKLIDVIEPTTNVNTEVNNSIDETINNLINSLELSINGETLFINPKEEIIESTENGENVEEKAEEEVRVTSTENEKELSSEEKLLQCMKNSVGKLNCSHCSMGFYAISCLEEHNKQIHKIPAGQEKYQQYVCIYCSENIWHKKDVYEHVTSKHSSELIFVCKRILKLGLHEDLPDNLMLINISNLNDFPTDEIDAKEKPDEQTQIDINIEIIKPLLRKLTFHTGIHRNELYQCTVQRCKANFSLFDMWSRHMTMRHNLKYVSCPHCIKYNISNNMELSLFKKHFEDHSQHNYLCFYCDKTFVNEKQIREHATLSHDSLVLNDIRLEKIPYSHNYTYYVLINQNELSNNLEFLLCLREILITRVKNMEIENLKQIVSRWNVPIKKLWMKDILIKYNTEPQKEIYVCTVCKFQNTSWPNISSHVKDNHSKRDVPVLGIFPGEDFTSVSISIIFASAKKIFTTFKKCFCCSESSFSVNSMEYHLKKDHQIALRYFCNICNEKLLKLEFSEEHFKNKHNEVLQIRCELASKCQIIATSIDPLTVIVYDKNQLNTVKLETIEMTDDSIYILDDDDIEIDSAQKSNNETVQNKLQIKCININNLRGTQTAASSEPTASILVPRASGITSTIDSNGTAHLQQQSQQTSANLQQQRPSTAHLQQQYPPTAHLQQQYSPTVHLQKQSQQMVYLPQQQLQQTAQLRQQHLPIVQPQQQSQQTFHLQQQLQQTSHLQQQLQQKSNLQQHLKKAVHLQQQLKKTSHLQQQLQQTAHLQQQLQQTSHLQQQLQQTSHLQQQLQHTAHLQQQFHEISHVQQQSPSTAQPQQRAQSNELLTELLLQPPKQPHQLNQAQPNQEPRIPQVIQNRRPQLSHQQYQTSQNFLRQQNQVFQQSTDNQAAQFSPILNQSGNFQPPQQQYPLSIQQQPQQNFQYHQQNLQSQNLHNPHQSHNYSSQQNKNRSVNHLKVNSNNIYPKRLP